MMKKTGNHALPAAPITHLTLRQGRGKVTLSSSAYKYQRRNQQVRGGKILKKEGRTENSGESLFERRGARAKQKKKEEKGERRVKGQDRRGRRRAIVAPPPAPPSFLPATTYRTAIAEKNHHRSANNSSHH
jgi:hypothetical protein